jgi:hypothetical protein
MEAGPYRISLTRPSSATASVPGRDHDAHVGWVKPFKPQEVGAIGPFSWNWARDNYGRLTKLATWLLVRFW